jgi:hypothetical protein
MWEVFWARALVIVALAGVLETRGAAVGAATPALGAVNSSNSVICWNYINPETHDNTFYNFKALKINQSEQMI